MTKKPIGYWTEETIISELEPIINKLGDFPTQAKLRKMKRSDLDGAIRGHGGFIYFRKKLGHNIICKPYGYWTEENIISELNPIIEELGYFPFLIELEKMKRNDLSYAITNHGGINHFRWKMGYKPFRKPKNYWTDETIIFELQPIINELGYFPSLTELRKMKKNDLANATKNYGGINYFRKKLGYEPKSKPAGYWTDEVIIAELNPIIKELGHFPTRSELTEMKRDGLASRIKEHGGLICFREKMGYEHFKKPKKHWTEETIISELEPIINKLGDFPTTVELKRMKRNDLNRAIIQHGGSNYFKVKLGYEPYKGYKIRHRENVCDIIKKHHDDLKNDPQRLSTEFLQKMLGTKCDIDE